MSHYIPPYVDQALRDWDFIAFFAYDGFEASGRGVVGLFEEDQVTKVMYGDRRYFDQLGNSGIIQMLDEYDPEHEFMVHFEAPGGTQTLRIQTPAGGRHPKRVWFFEMLRRVNDEPDKLPEHLPKWFITTCTELSEAQQKRAAEQTGEAS